LALEGWSDVVRLPDFERQYFNADHAGRRLDLAHLRGSGLIVGLKHDRQPANLAHKLAQQFDSLPPISAVWLDRPVTFPPGRASDATRPATNGSPAGANTIGISDVALFAATVGGVPDVKMTSTFERTNSAAMSSKRCVAAHRYSITIGTPIDPAKLVQLLHQNGDALAVARR